MAAYNQSTTVQEVLDHCKLHTKLQNFVGVGGIANSPGIRIANNIMQMLLTYRMPWKFNAAELGPTNGQFIVTQCGVQDIRHAGATGFTLLNSQPNQGTLPTGGAPIDLKASPVNGGTAGITVSGGVATVQFIDPHPFVVGQTMFMSGNVDSVYNSVWTFNQVLQTSAWTNGWVITSVPDNLHVTFAATGGQTISSGAPGITSFGWLQSAAVQDISSTSFPQPVKPIDAVHRLSPEYTNTGDELSVASVIDYGNGVIKFRLSQPLGTYALQINLVYQQRAPKIKTAQDVFAWPDDLSYVLVELALWQAYRFAYGIAESETMAQREMAMFAVQRALESEDREANDQAMTPLQSLM